MSDAPTSTTDERDIMLIQTAMAAHRLHLAAGAFKGIKTGVLAANVDTLSNALVRLTQLGIIEAPSEFSDPLGTVYVWRGFE